MTGLTPNASPLYEKVKSYILARIGDGTWQPHDRIPSENELVATLGVSRMTAHRAFRELSSAGMLVRVQGVGTFVAPPRAQTGILEINNIAAEIAKRGHRHRADVRLLERVPATPELRHAFEDEALENLFHSLVVHYEDDRTVQLEERYVSPRLVPAYDQQDFTKTTTYDYLVAVTPVTELEHIISAIAADAPLARALDISIGDPCLLLARRTWTGEQVVTATKLTYVGARYAFATRSVLKA